MGSKKICEKCTKNYSVVLNYNVPLLGYMQAHGGDVAIAATANAMPSVGQHLGNVKS